MKHLISQTVWMAAGATMAAAFSFAALEPALISAATSTQFTVTQTVTSEVAFSTPASNVTLSPSIGGLTGGTGNGGTQVVVSTNDHLGYSMTLTASSSLGMIGNTNPSNTIPAYVPAATNVPDFTFTTPVNRARFGYSVEASTTGDLVQAFKDDGANCNAGAGDTANACWLNASTTAFTIVNRSTATSASGATTTIKFRVVVNPNPVPSIPDDAYVATTTLTASAN